MTRISAGSLTLAGTNIALGRLGLGCARLFGGSEARHSARIIEAALETGIRQFDTAPSYSNGQSEEMLGAVLAGVPDVTIASKVGIAPSGAQPTWMATLYRRGVRPLLARTPRLKAALLRLRRRPTAVPALPPRRILSCDEIRVSLEGSLKRLRRERLDIFLIHEPDDILIDEALRLEFLQLQREGLIGGYGLGWGRIVEDSPPFGQVVQSRYAESEARVGTETRIHHGVLRDPGRLQTYSASVLSAGIRLHGALARRPDAGLLFSASSPSQIRDIAEDWVAEEERLTAHQKSRGIGLCKPT